MNSKKKNLLIASKAPQCVGQEHGGAGLGLSRELGVLGGGGGPGGHLPQGGEEPAGVPRVPGARLAPQEDLPGRPHTLLEHPQDFMTFIFFFFQIDTKYRNLRQGLRFNQKQCSL